MHSTEIIETVVLVDDNDNVIGTAAKRDVHHSETPLHRGFSVFVFDGGGRLLLQRRAWSKRTWPGAWSNSCCGHPALGESPEQAAARRLDFELGLMAVDLTLVLPEFRYRAEKDDIVENEICPVLVGFTDEQPCANPDEVAETKWVDWDVFVDSLDGAEISPWAILETRELVASDDFHKLRRTRTAHHD